MMTTMSRRGFLALSSGAALASTLGTIRAASGQETIDEITWSLPTVPETLFVPHFWSTEIGVIMSLVQEGPLLFGDDLSMIPGPAESWEMADSTTAVYHLRSGVTFSDGSPLTADDVVATVKYHLRPDSGSQVASFYSSVDSAEATDRATVTVKLKSPNVQFKYWAAVMAGFLFKKDQLGNDDLGTPDLLPLGTGPYKLVEFVPAQRVVLEARDDYWGSKPIVKKITIVAIPDEQTRILAMQNGDIDGTFNVSVSEIDQWKALGNVDVITQPSLGVYLLTLDQSAAPFDDIHARKAISYAIDREGLVKALLKGNGEPATALNPPEMWVGIMPPDEVRKFYATLPTCQFDLEQAKAELKQSKYPDGFEITVPSPKADPYKTNILQSVAENLRQIGITAKVQEMDDAQWWAGYLGHENLGMQISGYAPDFADASNYPSLFFSSANARKDGMNASNFKNPEVDKALATANENSDPKVRGEALKQVFRIAGEDAAVVPIFWPRSAMAIRNKYTLTGYNALWYNIPWTMRGFGLKT
ncbi:ABC transporter substrate-binding protein [Mesorhizobium sp. WSM3862]|uniref:ABC transporter substrate-binding protein n=1 Tax=Mesorhizobium sp. WSM3862 TaxID=632858 RepID=UPI000BB09320|nr:ABC transporter substrate-binding protein [Mesorhizobium sp. WSM3862]PBB94726.1 ABC transporter substrate-binding protein [Mesorhizobium sp. WSM3862]